MTQPRKHLSIGVKISACLFCLGIPEERHTEVLQAFKDRMSASQRKRDILDILLVQWGIDSGDVQWDHSPPLALRDTDWQGASKIYYPDELDPQYLVPMSKADHQHKTSGAAQGAGKSNVANSDIHKIAKVNRLLASGEKSPAAGKKLPASRWPKGRKIQSRGFK